MKRSLSGIQPSGILHLGNYFGAIEQFCKNARGVRRILFCSRLPFFDFFDEAARLTRKY
ncbi:Tryptophan--tRNA ligase [Fusobacterium necrophorum subsp. necrophorum]|nr:Tryptophan--tRNA ligase [Fusobacterium necrophorum subsp. necrophorum]